MTGTIGGMRTHRSQYHLGLLALLAMATAALVAGCGSGAGPGTAATAPAQTPEAKPISNTDPCAMQLHDLSGTLLLFYFNHGRLPADAAELEQEATELVCPASGTAYVYNPSGILFAEQGERDRYLVLYDATPAHGGLRQGIIVREPDEAGTLTTDVIALPERFFALRLPAAAR